MSLHPRIPRSPRVLLGCAAGLLGLLALLAGDGHRPVDGRVDVAALARVAESEGDHVTALELAEWVRAGKPGLRIVDVRAPREYEAYHVPGAERLALAELPGAGFRRDETIVLYSDGGAHAAQGWVFLRAMGLEGVYFLRGGVREWMEEVLEPTIPPDPPASEREAVERRLELSRYFGGMPRDAAEAPPPPANTGDATERWRRRSC